MKKSKKVASVKALYNIFCLFHIIIYMYFILFNNYDYLFI